MFGKKKKQKTIQEVGIDMDIQATSTKKNGEARGDPIVKLNE